jgi:hypothetical protein
MTKPNSALQNQDQVHLSVPSGQPMQAPLPVVATSHMMNAAVNAWHSWKSRDNGGCIQELGRLMWEHMADAAPSQPAPALQAGGDETPVAYEFLHPNGHAIVDYSEHTHVGHLSAEKGYVKRALVYARPTPAAAAGVPTNQCDGCARGLPLANGIHRGPGSWDVQGCTANMYASPVAPAGVPTCYQVTEQHPENKAFWDGVRWAQDGAVLSAGAPAVPLQDEQDSSSVHLADNGSSRALRAASQESPRPEMKLCPFCGYAQCGVIPDADEDGPMYHGYCAACDTEGPVVYSTAIKMAAEADAIAAWNRRPIRCDGRDGVTGSAASSEAAEGTSSSSGTDGHGKDCA